ncbi:MAG: LysR family transcriptional regulator [Planctomycetota bacterium]|nr:LysR family transcriptional regulator [Planctomycetota bacterium]
MRKIAPTDPGPEPGMANTDPLSIRQLEVFVALVEAGSFTAAARQLGLSQSTVSGHIADLERRLGMRLVGRERSGVTPTGAGQVLLKPARDALRAERNTRMAAAELTGLLSGSLTLGGSTIPAVYLLPPLLRGFRQAHDGVTIRLLTGDSSEILSHVQDGSVDVGCVGARPRARGLKIAEIGADSLVLIAPPGHELAGRKAVSVPDVLAHPFVLREEGSGTRKAMLDGLGLPEDGGDLTVSCHVGSTEAVKAAVRAGLGVSFVSDLAVADAREAGTLVVMPVRGFNVRRSFWLLSREDEHLSPAGRAFWEEAGGK